MLISVVSVLLILTVYGFYSVPDELTKLTDGEIRVNDLFTVSYDDGTGAKSRVSGLPAEEGSYRVNISLFHAIPIKESKVTVGKRQYAVVSGEIFGLRMYMDGVLVVGTQEIDTASGKVNPAGNAGIRKGDLIVSINGESVKNCSKVCTLLENAAEKPVTMVIRRNGKNYSVSLTSAYSVSEQRYRAGLWIKDSAAGIGTVTFYDKDTGMFAGLGHAVCDVDTGSILPMSYGDTVKAAICGCYKGKSGQAGELCGTFSGETTGVLLLNSPIGVYGCLTTTGQGTLMPVALKDEVRTGKAQIISTVNENGPSAYEINIIKVDANDSEHRNMIIEVTDSRLLDITGGIVQGMSGSPIIQNGMLVGAVTHVFVNDPTKGYGIFALDMMAQKQAVEMRQAG